MSPAPRTNKYSFRDELETCKAIHKWNYVRLFQIENLKYASKCKNIEKHEITKMKEEIDILDRKIAENEPKVDEFERMFMEQQAEFNLSYEAMILKRMEIEKKILRILDKMIKKKHNKMIKLF